MKILIFHKKPIKRRDCLKRGLGQLANLRGREGGLSRKRRWCFLKGGGGADTPVHTMLLDQTEGERKTFLGGSKKGSHIVRLLPRALGCLKRRKNLSFCEI